MYDTVEECGEQTIIKGKITTLTSDNTTSLQSDNVQNIGEISNSITIEAVVSSKTKLDNLKIIMYIYLNIRRIFCKTKFLRMLCMMKTGLMKTLKSSIVYYCITGKTKIEIMKKIIDSKNEELLKRYQKKKS